MDKDYKFLSISSIIFKVLAWVFMAAGFVFSIVIFVGGGTPEAPRTTGFIAILLGLAYFFIFFIASEVITLLLEIHNKVNKGSSAA